MERQPMSKEIPKVARSTKNLKIVLAGDCRKYMNALKESEKEAQVIIKTIPNVAKTTKQPTIELASNSTKEENHTSNAPLPCISIKPLKDKKYFCGICNVKSSGEIDLMMHVQGLRHKVAKKKYGCNNIVLKQGNLYYCRCCDFTLASREIASEHIKEKKHMNALNESEMEAQVIIKTIPNVAKTTKQPTIELASDSTKEEKHISNAPLPCISIKPLKDQKYFCEICNVESYGEKDLETHVKGLRHKRAKKKYGCYNIVLKQGNLYYCRCCDFTLASREIASEHIKGEKHMYALKESEKEGLVIIKTIPNVAKTTKPPTVELASDSTKEEKHISNAPLPCISIKPLKDKKYFCEICNVESYGEKDLETHVKGLRHKRAQNEYGCYNISVQEDSKYYCGCCDHILANRQLASDHIKEARHKSNSNLPCISIMPVDTNMYHCRICDKGPLNQTNLESHVNGKQHKKAQWNYRCDQISLRSGNWYHCEYCNCTLSNRKLASKHVIEKNHRSNGHLLCISIKPVDVNEYYCRICNIKSSDRYQLENHVNGVRHIQAEKKYGCNNIVLKQGNVYYCRCCDFTLASREIASEHIKGEKHMNALKESEKEGLVIIKTIPNVAKTTKPPTVELASDSTKEEKHISNAPLPCISIKPLKDKKYFCEICNVESYGEKDLETHVKGLRHKRAKKEYGCYNIVLKQGNLYYCRCCDFTLASREIASEHIKGEKHMNALKESEKEGLVIIKTIPNVAKTTKPPTVELASDSTKEEKHISNAPLPCISIKPLKDKKYFCEICNVESYGEKDLETHVKGLRHERAQNEYGCYNISVQEDSKYYCGCCDHILANRQLASDHIKEARHKSNSNLPCISIMPVDTNMYHCRICDKGPLNQTNLESHVNGKQHKKAQWNYRCDQISLRSGNWYHCEYCNCTLSNRKLASKHVIEKNHRSNGHLLCISIKPVDVNEYYCRICNIKSSDRYQLENHVNGVRHIQAEKKYGCNNIVHKNNNLYYCRSCKFILSSRAIAFQHIMEKKHMSSLKLSADEDKLTRKEIPKVAATTNQPKSNSEPICKNLSHAYILKKTATNFYCAVCNCEIYSQTDVKAHAKQKQHLSAIKQFSDHKISLNKHNFFYCEYCSCKISGLNNVYKHIRGTRHAVSTVNNKSVAENEKQITNNTIPMKVGTKNPDNASVFNGIPNLKTTSSSLSSNLIKSLNLFSEVTSKATSGQTRNSKKSRATQKVRAEIGWMRCLVCNASVEGATNLHIHMAQHFSDDFIISDRNEKSTEQIEVTKTKTTSQFKFTEDEDCNEEAVQRIERTVNMKKIIKDLNFDADHIYSMEDKTADIKLGMQLCYPSDEERIYCFVCQTEVEMSMQDYHQHLKTKEHCEYLDQIEKDHSLFDRFPDQFSQLDLAQHYMIDTECDFVYCFICDLEFNNIQQHIREKNHRERCVELHEKAEKNFENIKLEGCDWYEVAFYWCVPCITRFQSEVQFTKHLKSQIHADCMKQKQNKNRKLIFDFCAPCALLWYGYRCTSAYHDHVKTHMWLRQDGYYSSTAIPASAKLLLINPEDCVNKTIKYFDEISAKERAKEETLIRDIEKLVSSKFLHAKAYIFGSRVSGLGSPDSDIDIFLHCGNMYDREPSSRKRILNYMTDVHECLSEEPHLWDVEELLMMCRSPIIRVHHRITGLSCDISFENETAVQNTLLIKSFNDIYPSCRKMILIIKEWLKLCELSGSERIRSYAIYWFVIFFLQTESILPSIATLIRMKNESPVIAGWEDCVFRNFTSNAMEHNFSIKELLIRFFKFYANFDYRYKVACPLLGEVVEKRTFTDPESLPEAMSPYKAHVKNSDRVLRIDSVMCIQDPLDLQHNLAKAVSKVHLNRFRKYCSQSLDVLHAF